MTEQQQQQQEEVITTKGTAKWKSFVFGCIVGILVSNMEKCVETIGSIGLPPSSSSLQWQQQTTTDDNNDDNNIIKAKAVAAAVSSTKSLLLDNKINNGNDDYHNSNNIHLASLKQIQKPAKCGVVFFYHNGGTGGSSFNHYLLSYIDLGYQYFTAWGSTEKIKAKFIDGTTKHIQNLTTPNSNSNCTGRKKKLGRRKSKYYKRNNITKPKFPPPPIVDCQSWKMIHSHHMSGGMNDTLEYFQQWKYDVEQVQGCKFLLTTIARDPLDHFLAKFRYMKKNYTIEEFIAITRKQKYLEYFMYNWNRLGGTHAKREPYIEYPNTTEVVRRALEIVDNYYDIIVMDSNVTKLEYAVGEWTGWPKNPSIHKNSGKDSLSFTKKEIKEIRAILDKDGDTEFYRQLKLRQASDDYPNVI